MGSKEKTTTTQTSSTTPTADPSMVEQNALDLDLRKRIQEPLGQLQGNSVNLSNLFIQGKKLPGYFEGLPGGISPDVTQSIVNQSLRDIQPMYQGAGLIDSGARVSGSIRAAADIRNQSEQFNIQNLMQLLNLAQGGQAQVQQPIIGQSGMLGQRLAGLTSMNQTGTSAFQSNQNPFMNSFAGGLGQGIGSSMNPFSFIGGGKVGK